MDDSPRSFWFKLGLGPGASIAAVVFAAGMPLRQWHTVGATIHLTDGGYFDAPVDYCKAKTLVIQPGTLLWK